MADTDSPLPFSQNDEAPPPAGRRSVASVIAWGMTAAWLAAGIAYVHLALGWDLAGLRAGETAGLISGLVLPLAILWQTLASLENSRLLRRETQALGEQLRQLLYPAVEHEGRVRTMADSLRAQAKAMTAASTEAASRTQAERLALRVQMEEMERLADRVETAFATPVQSLRREVARVEEVTGAAVACAREVEERLAAQIKEAARTSATTLSVVQGSFGKVNEEARGFEAQAQALCERLEGAAAAVGSRLGQLTECGDDVVQHFDRLGRALESQGAVVAEACGRAEATTATLSQRGSMLETSLARQAEILGALAERLTAGGERLVASFTERGVAWETALAAAERTGAALAARVDDSTDRLRGAGETAALEVGSLAQRLDTSGDALQAAAVAINERLTAASEWFESSRQAMQGAAGGMGQEARDLTTAGDAAAAKLAEVRQAIGLHLQGFATAAALAEQTAAALEQRTQGVAELLARNGQELAATVERLALDGSNAAAAVERQAALLDDSTGRARDSLDAAERGLAQQMQRLNAAAADAAERLNEGGDGLEQRRQALAQTAEAIDARLERAGTDLDRRRSEIDDMAARLEHGLLGFTAMVGGAVDTVQACVDALAAHAEGLGNAFDSAEGAAAHLDERGVQLDQLMQSHREQLAQTVGRLVGEAAAAAALLGRETESLRRTAVEIAERAHRAESEIGTGTERLMVACTNAVEAVVRTTTTLTGEGEALAGRAAPVCRQLSELATTLAAEREALVRAGDTLLPIGESTAARLAEVARNLSQHQAEALTAAEAAQQAVQAVDNGVERGVAGLGQQIERIAAEGERLGDSLERHQGKILQEADGLAAAAALVEGRLASETQRLETVCEQATARAMAAVEKLSATIQALANASEAARATTATTTAATKQIAANKPASTGFGLKLLYGMARATADEDEKKK